MPARTEHILQMSDFSQRGGLVSLLSCPTSGQPAHLEGEAAAPGKRRAGPMVGVEGKDNGKRSGAGPTMSHWRPQRESLCKRNVAPARSPCTTNAPGPLPNTSGRPKAGRSRRPGTAVRERPSSRYYEEVGIIPKDGRSQPKMPLGVGPGLCRDFRESSFHTLR